jgi:ABC-type cobalamin/Fe3+-siderophores transport system ATPase subunit
MITRLYADNFRCLSNFEVKFELLTILLGPNGSGKSACLDLIAGLRDLILGSVTAGKLFPSETRTRWDKRPSQTFELGLCINEDEYSYRLVIGHHDDPPRGRKEPTNRIQLETVLLNGQTLYTANIEETLVYNDSGGGGIQLMTDWQVSGISRVHVRKDNQKLIAFRDFFSRLPVVALNPYAVKAVTRENVQVFLPSLDCSDFTDFIANLIASDAQVMRPVEEALKEGTLPDLIAFEARSSGDSSIVTCLFRNQEGPSIRFRLDELSSGQIASVILQTMSSFAEVHGGALVLDEPGNFLAVSEMQPFLASLETLSLEHGRQVIISTHHPIAIDFLAAGHGLWFERDTSGPTRSPVPLHVPDDVTSKEAYLRVSDLISRGWLSGIGVETHELNR